MTLKSVIDVDINDAKFSRFKDLFDKYTAALDKTPGVWKEAGKQQGALTSNFEKAAAALMSQSALSGKVSEASGEQVAHLRAADGLWTSMARSASGVVGSIASIGTGLLRWSGLAAGLLGVGGLFGLDRLAVTVAAQRRRAMGLGMSTGPVSAFDINFSRLLDTGSYLSGVNQMETDVTAQAPAWALLGHGLTGNTAADSMAMLRAARGLAQRTQTGMLGPTFSAYGLGGMFDAETQRRLQTMSGTEFAELAQNYTENSAAMNIKDTVAKDWQDLATNLERVSAKLTKDLAGSLDALVPKLITLSTNFEKAVAAFAKSGLIQKAIDDLASALGWIDGAITGWRNFRSSLRPWDTFTDPDTPYDPAKDTWSNLWNRVTDWFSKSSAVGDPKAYFSRLDAKYGLPPGSTELIKNLENSSANAVSPQGAEGMFQMKPWLAAHYGAADPFNWVDEAEASARFRADVQAKYRGNFAEILAAYNAGEPAVDAALARAARSGGNWLALLKPETQAYVGRAVTAYAPAIRIENNTGGSAVVAVCQLAPSGVP